MKVLYDTISNACSKEITQTYSTSFSLGIKSLATRFHTPIYAIYGFVRLADEIVDSFHAYDKVGLLDQLSKDTYKALDQGISINPVLNSFQKVVRSYGIEHSLIDAFLKSMRFDLDQYTYSRVGFEEYVYGSAEVVGLMCLQVFVEGDKQLYESLKPAAKSLGAAFQKINFLRDLQEDYKTLGRTYFPGVDFETFTDADKIQIELEIAKDFKAGYEGVKKLPIGVKFGVYVAYAYYFRLFQKIKNTPSKNVMKARIRIHNVQKGRIFVLSYLKHSFKMI
jgi:phytoene synthase